VTLRPATASAEERISENVTLMPNPSLSGAEKSNSAYDVPSISAKAAVGASAERGLRVLYVCHVGEMGGAEWSLVDLVQGIGRSGVEAVVALPGPGPLALEMRRARASVVHCSALARLRRASAFEAALRLYRGMGQVRRAAEEHGVDLVHANSASAGLFSLAAARPLIWHVRDLVAGPETAWIAHTAALAIAPSRACARLLASLAPGARVAVVPNGIDLSRFASICPMAESRGESGPLAVAVGHLLPWKGHDILLDAVRLVRDAGVTMRLVVVGGDPFGDGGGVISTLQGRIEDNGLADVVRLAGMVDDVVPWLARAHLTIHAAYPEPFGRVVVESMAAGVPVVAFAGEHGPAEILANGEGGWLAGARTPRALAEAILQALANPRALRERGDRARTEAMARYDRNRMAASVADAYRDVLRRRKEQKPS
jgi:glycosyltransferase involved in cell wall biosynthesis